MVNELEESNCLWKEAIGINKATIWLTFKRKSDQNEPQTSPKRAPNGTPAFPTFIAPRLAARV